MPQSDKDDHVGQLGQLLKVRREGKGLTRPEMVEEVSKLGVRLSPNYLAKIELGYRPLGSVSLEAREALRTILGISKEEWQSTTSLYVPIDVHEQAVLNPARAVPREGEHDGLAYFAVYPSDNIENADAKPSQDETVSISHDHLRGAALAKVRVFAVGSNCQVSQWVQASPKSVGAGDYVAFDTSREPTPDDVVVTYDEQAEKVLVKRHVEEGRYVILHPIDTSDLPVVRPKAGLNPRLLGVAIWRGGGL